MSNNTGIKAKIGNMENNKRVIVMLQISTCQITQALRPKFETGKIIKGEIVMLQISTCQITRVSKLKLEIWKHGKY